MCSIIPIEDFLSNFDGVKRMGDNAYQCRCPVHKDDKASLTITQGEDRLLLHCHAGCETKDILEEIGLKFSDIQAGAEKPSWKANVEKWKGKKIAATYHFYDEKKKYVYTKVRFQDKEMLFGRIDKDTLYFKAGIKGVNRTLYHLNEAIQAVKDGQAVYYVEGEKDVDTLAKLGLCGVTAGGAKDWRKEYAKYFKGAEVYILPDNDEPGKELAANVQRDISPVAKSVKVVMTSQAEKGDVTDYLTTEGHSKEELLSLIANSEGEKTSTSLETISAVELQKKDLPPVRFIVEDMFPQGLALLCSPPKFGKSWFVLDLCLSVAAGHHFLGKKTEKCKCLYLALEDSQHRLKDRMNKVLLGGIGDAPEGFDYAVNAKDLDTGLIEQLEEYILSHQGIGLIVIDTFQKVRGPGGKGSAYAEDYRDTGKIKELADKHGVCILLVHHLRKAADEGDVFARISGTNGVLGAADAAFVLSRASRNDERTKMSMTGRDISADSFYLEFDKGMYRWRVLGSVEEQEEIDRKQAYDRNPIVITIKSLLKESPSGWQGTADELGERMRRIAGTHMDSAKIGKELKAVDCLLQKYDRIIYTDFTQKNRRLKKIQYLDTHTL